MNGFLCVLKPPGMTSSDVVVRVRRKLGKGVKVGHAGTLDPEASGVLPLMIGRAARLFDYLVEKEKTYVAQLKPGYATDTQDAHGAIIAGEGAHATRAQLEAVLPRFIGEIAQIPPMYSALKRDGQKLCDLARQGIDVKVEPRPTQVYAIQVLHENADGSFMLQIRCGRGTYIRTLCHDIGEALGTKAHMGMLLRADGHVYAGRRAHDRGNRRGGRAVAAADGDGSAARPSAAARCAAQGGALCAQRQQADAARADRRRSAGAADAAVSERAILRDWPI